LAKSVMKTPCVFLAHVLCIAACSMMITAQTAAQAQQVGCTDRVTAMSALRADHELYQTFISQGDFGVKRVQFPANWVAGSQVLVSLCAGFTSSCENEQGKQVVLFKSTKTKTATLQVNYAQGDVSLKAGQRYFWKLSLISGSISVGVVASPDDECDWSDGMEVQGGSVVTIWPAPYLRYRMKLFQ